MDFLQIFRESKTTLAYIYALSSHPPNECAHTSIRHTFSSVAHVFQIIMANIVYSLHLVLGRANECVL